MTRLASVLLGLSAGVALTSCATPDAPLPVVRTDSVPVKPAGGLARLVLHTAGIPRPALENDRASLAVRGFDAGGMPIGTNGATISLSDSSVAEIAVTTEDVFTFAGKHIDTHVEIRFLKAGRLTITAQLDTLSAATTVDVLSLAPSTAVAVDSFAIVEFRVPCVGSCNYLAYLPVFRFREATGKATATVAGVSIYLDGGMSLGPCRGEFTLQAGESLEVTGLESYIWLTGLLGVRLDGTRVEGDSATAELLVRDGTGGYARLEKRGPILKLEANPVVPTSPDPGWSC